MASTSTSAPALLSQHVHDGKSHLLLCASGSVATIKIPNIITALSHHPRLSIRLILTAPAAHFLAGQAAEQPTLSSIRDLPNVDGVYLDEDEWAEPWKRGGKILHIELRRWADVMVVAPLSANTLAKMAGGLCDNLLLSTMRAWDTTGLIDGLRATPDAAAEQADGRAVSVTARKVIVVAPAMNTAMWSHPVTKQHMKLLEGEWNVENGGWIQILRPVEKELACGDTGSGAMADWKSIVKVIEEGLGLKSSGST
ncbi:phosphopantothenoylcysteine decarboxylase [Rhizodiscina lignyota]|uniref:Phosphopantothenoylcysteine decarboxylase n=1 Tax=Rhizodiscina lignyota TaxID=1504668 RepID=A0A9P4IJV6_9PEZI|nr:phosphopantothenoylcysteine decarboxylase [Rhizodiscina lignyota]